MNIASRAPALTLTLAGLLSAGALAAPQRGGRLAPPPRLDCRRDDTTSFTGRVVAYRRRARSLFLRVRTDEQTTEEFTLRAGRGGLGALFRLRGATFREDDWRRIETRAGRLRPHVRATVWACYEGDEPRARLIDWSPPE